MIKKPVRIEFDEDIMTDIEEICDKYKYSKANLVRTVFTKCLDIIKTKSLDGLLDGLDEIKNPKQRKML